MIYKIKNYTKYYINNNYQVPKYLLLLKMSLIAEKILKMKEIYLKIGSFLNFNEFVKYLYYINININNIIIELDNITIVKYIPKIFIDNIIKKNIKFTIKELIFDYGYGREYSDIPYKYDMYKKEFKNLDFLPNHIDKLSLKSLQYIDFTLFENKNILELELDDIDCSNIHHYKNLKKIKLIECYNFLYQIFNDFENLKYLELSFISDINIYWTEEYQFTPPFKSDTIETLILDNCYNIKCKFQLKNLKELQIIGDEAHDFNFNFTLIEDLVNIKYIYLEKLSLLKNDKLPNSLEKLHINNCICEDFNFINNLPNLQEVSIINTSADLMIAYFSSKSIVKLILHYCDFTIDFTELKNLLHLEIICDEDNISIPLSLNDFKSIDKLINLNYLHLNYFYLLSDDKLPDSLKKLDIYNCICEKYNFVKRLINLQEFSIKECNPPNNQNINIQEFQECISKNKVYAERNSKEM